MSDIATVGLLWLGAAAGLLAIWAWALRDRRRQERDLERRYGPYGGYFRE